MRRRKAGVPEDVGFATKPEIALAADAPRWRPACRRRGADRRRLWRRQVPRRDHRAGPALRVGSLQPTARLAARSSTGPLRQGLSGAAGRRAGRGARRTHRADPGQGTRHGSAGCGLADGHLARGRQRLAELALRPAAGAAAQRGTSAERSCATRNGCWSNGPRTRTSRPSTGSRPCRRHRVRTDGRPRQAALADRAGLSGTEAGSRARPLRGARMAGLPSPRQPLHRRLRIPGLRDRRRFPPRDRPAAWRRPRSAVPAGYRPEVLPMRSQRHMPNSIATLRIRLAPYLGGRFAPMSVLRPLPCEIAGAE